MSRRDFLKIIGATGVSLTLGGLGAFSFVKPPASYYASAQSSGSWQLGGQTHATAIHIAALHNGKVLYVAGSGFYTPHELGPFEQGVYNPATNSSTALPNINEDMFCVGQSMLPNGNVLFTGGQLQYDNRSANGKFLGLNAAWVYDVPTNVLRRVANMKHGRWYPTQVLLANGKTLVVGGYDEYGTYNKLAEIFDPATETFSIMYDPSVTTTYCAGAGEDPAIMPGAGSQCYGPGVAPGVLLYPRMHLMPGGLVAVCGQSKTMRTFNPATGVWKFAGNMLFGAARGYGSSVLLPLQNTTAEKGNVLLFGGTATSDSFATTHAEIVTTSGTALVSRLTTPSAFGRKHPIPVILPDGNVLVIGGTTYQNSSANKVMEAELFNPVTETWTTLPAMTVPRLYHSAGVLLPDGRVWVGGTTISKSSRELRVEYFIPSYFSATRPTISGTPDVGNYGETITVPTPNGLTITSVSLLAISSETHGGNSDQRLVWLQIQSQTATQVVVSAPLNANIAPPSYYYLHVIKQGIPSLASIIKIPGSAPPSDTTIPTISIVSPTVDQVVTGPSPSFAVTITGTAADVGSGLQLVELSIDAGAYTAAAGTSSWSFTTAPLTAGVHTINARAKDNAGNFSAIVVRSFTVAFTAGGSFVSIYSVAGDNSYGPMASTGAATDTTGQGELITTTSSLIGSKIKRVSVKLKKAGTTSGTIFVRIRNATNAIVKEIGTVDAAALTAVDQTFVLTAATQHTLAANDKVLVEWYGNGSLANVVSVKRQGVDAFNGTATYFVTRKTSGSYTNSTTRDLAGTWEYET